MPWPSRLASSPRAARLPGVAAAAMPASTTSPIHAAPIRTSVLRALAQVGDRPAVVRLAEHRGSRHEHVRTGPRGALDRVGCDAAVHLELHGELALVDPAPELR